ncbi:uncharacterized protein LOC110623640 [Manihot esculenta]|uniref:Uncharacterized protein n=1 Tax=Manihot esculenta TaxID=3983 RepID=A0A2C9VAA8_MANES|nr:uncharacterized protein LOC110623640 [Manihot esculenta]OAY41072.1 hypothetical protein MANES_09G071900v8 [Manihot esculenta]
MSLIRNAIRSKFPVRAFKLNHADAVAVCYRQPPKLFSTEAKQPPASEDSSIDPFLQNTGTGMVYAKLFGITRQTLKTDIINLLEGCNLTLDDIKVNYNRSFVPVGMMLQFPSRVVFDNAFKVIAKKGRLYRLENADRSQWDILMPHDGKTLLLEGIPRNAQPEDVERFLSGCEYDPSSIQLSLRQGFPDPIRIARVRCNTRTQAMNAFITKNRGFCLNNQVSVRVLQ